MSGFKFGATGGPFGSQPTTTSSVTPGFGVAGAQTTQSTAGGFSFGQPSTTSTASTGFKFGTPTGTTGVTQPSSNASATPTSSGFGFAAKTTSTATPGGLTLGATPGGSFSFSTPANTTASSKPATGFTFGAQPPTATTTTTATTGGFSLAGSSAPTTSSTSANPLSTGFSATTGTGISGLLSGGASKPAAGFGALASLVQTTKATTSTTQAGGLNIGGTLSAGAVSKSSTSSAGFQLSSSSSAPTAALNIKTSTATTGAPTSQPSTTTATSNSTTPASAATTSTAAAAASAGPSMTYKELEDQMNKWWVELESQEKVFLEQATRVNAWDKILVENGQKITDLNSDVEKVKLDQHRLNHELDFIVAQQKELEEMLEPLERSVAQLPSINYQQHTDTERERTYQIAENIDAQLKRMTEDLKEVIDHLNTASGTQDSNDPMLQISKILNAHMESLQWIDRSAATLQSKMDQVSRSADQSRKEHERSIRLAYS